MVEVAAGSVFLMLGVAVRLKPPRLNLESGEAAELTTVETDAGVRLWPNLKPPLVAVPGAAPVTALGVTDTAADGPSLKPPLGVVPGATLVPALGVTDTASDGSSLKPPLTVVDVAGTLGVAGAVFPKPNPNVVAAVVTGALSPKLKTPGGAAVLGTGAGPPLKAAGVAGAGAGEVLAGVAKAGLEDDFERAFWNKIMP